MTPDVVPLGEHVEFAREVKRMRAAQRAYFDSRGEPARVRDQLCRQAKDRERRVDRLVDAAILRESERSLFDGE